jgi:hypothetical protein
VLSDKQILHPIRALRIIESLATHTDALNNIEEEPRHNDEKALKLIYYAAHCASMPDCIDNHPDFLTKILEVEKDLVAGKSIPPWEEPE